MSKISNVLTMLQLLQSGRKYSISELASILEVSERMIRVYKEDLTFKIMGSFESDPTKGLISNESPIGKALIGKKVGDVVEVKTPMENLVFEVKSIKY